MTRTAVLQRQGGRRIKKVPKGERTQIGVIVGGKTKALLLKAMKESGRTISREAEHMIEKALAYEDMQASMKRRLEELGRELERGDLEAALHRLGYPMQRHVIDGRAWKAWAEPGHPWAATQPTSGFQPWTEEEAKRLTEAGYPPAKEDAP